MSPFRRRRRHHRRRRRAIDRPAAKIIGRKNTVGPAGRNADENISGEAPRHSRDVRSRRRLRRSRPKVTRESRCAFLAARGQPPKIYRVNNSMGDDKVAARRPTLASRGRYRFLPTCGTTRAQTLARLCLRSPVNYAIRESPSF